MKSKFLLLSAAAVFGMFMMHSCNNDEYWDENFGSLAERRMTRSVTEDEDGSDKETITYTFPSVEQIAANPVVRARMDACWQTTLDNCNDSTRQEFGFLIYKNHETGQLYCGEDIGGNIVKNNSNETPSVTFSFSSNDINVCGFFHAHTSLQYTEGYERNTGPSNKDREVASNQKVPGLLYDYATSTIKSGDSKSSPYMLYTITPPNKRESITITLN